MKEDITDLIFQDERPKKYNKDKRNNLIVVILSGILLILAAMYIYQNREQKRILGEINKEKTAIQAELTQISASYDSLKTENETLNSEILTAQTKVKDLLLEVEQTKKISFEKITRYQSEITSLRAIMRDYIVQVDSLNRRNQELMAENQEVKEQYKQVESENEKLNEKADQLQKNLDRAAQLEASGLIAEPLNDRSKDTRFANRTEKIRVTLTLSSNVTTKRGAKNIYLRIRRPDHLLLAKSPNDLFKFEDLNIQYSAVREVNYEGNELPVNIFWDNAGEPELMPGQYTVDVFVDENNIGTTTFELK
jgi:FtsZ-binding cell division protein ZapB